MRVGCSSFRLVSFYAYAYIRVIEADGSSAELLSITPDLPNSITDIALQENGKLLVIGATCCDEILGRSITTRTKESTSAANLRFETTHTNPATTVRRGHEITYTITVHNNGPAKAGHVTFKMPFPTEQLLSHSRHLRVGSPINSPAAFSATRYRVPATGLNRVSRRNFNLPYASI